MRDNRDEKSSGDWSLKRRPVSRVVIIWSAKVSKHFFSVPLSIVAEGHHCLLDLSRSFNQLFPDCRVRRWPMLAVESCAAAMAFDVSNRIQVRPLFACKSVASDGRRVASGGYAWFLKRQLSLPVSMVSQS